MEATREQLVEADEVGDKIADSIIDYFADEQNRHIIERLRAAGLQFEQRQQTPESEALRGVSIVISGSFRDHSRDELKAMIEAHGGKNLAAVSANTTYLLAGDKIGPAKLQKARKLNVPIVSEDEFYRMLADNMVGDTDDLDGADDAAEDYNDIAAADPAGNTPLRSGVKHDNAVTQEPSETQDIDSNKAERPQQGSLF